jgi:hypothetical protein
VQARRGERRKGPMSVALHCKKQRAFSPIMSNRFCTSFTVRYP